VLSLPLIVREIFRFMYASGPEAGPFPDGYEGIKNPRQNQSSIFLAGKSGVCPRGVAGRPTAMVPRGSSFSFVLIRVQFVARNALISRSYRKPVDSSKIVSLASNTGLLRKRYRWRTRARTAISSKR